jgi:exosortase A
MSDAMGDEQSTQAQPQVGGAGATFTFLCLLLLIFILGVFYQTTSSMVSTWIQSETYTHGFLILPIVIWLIWRKRSVLSTYPPRPSYPALIPLFLAGLLWMLGHLVDVLVVQQLALVAMLVFSFLVVMGVKLFRALLFPLAFLFFAVPMGEGLIPPMMEYTATATVFLVKLTGIPVYRDGMFISLPSGDWSVVEACSGVRYLISSVTLGCLFAYINYNGYKKRLAFIVVSMIVPIIANGLRAFMIVMLGHFSGMTLAVGVDHLIYGWVFFGLVMLILFSIGSRWQDTVENTHTPQVESDRDRDAPVPTVIAAPRLVSALMVTIAAIGLWPAWVYALNHFQVGGEFGQIVIPQGGETWQQSSERAWKWTPRVVHADREISQFYTPVNGDDTGIIQLYIAQYLEQKQGAEVVNSSNKLFNNQMSLWRISQKTNKSISIGGRSVDVTSAVVKGPRWNLLVWHWYRVGSDYTANNYVAKLREVEARLIDSRRDAAVLTVATPIGVGDVTEETAAAARKLQQFLDGVMPDLEQSMDQVVDKAELH